MIHVTRDIVVIGGSAGALPVTEAILTALPATFPASVCIALHRHSDPRDALVLTKVLARSTAMAVEAASDEASLRRGRVYVTASDHHLVLENGILRLQESPRENRFRPSIDALFKSAASAYGRRVIGILLSGAFGNDGASGLWHIRERGGVTIVQDPADAQCPGMPRAALAEVAVDHVLPGAQIGPMLKELVLSSATGFDGQSLRLLIVEDESVIATNLQQSLTEMGYQVIDWVRTGEAAIELAEREVPDMILMDIHLDGPLDGIESARRIWQKLQIPIVFCTAHADLATLKAAQTAESYGYLVKPFQSSAVRAAIELALARREKELR